MKRFAAWAAVIVIAGSGLLLRSHSPAGTPGQHEATSVDPDGDGVESIDDGCPLLDSASGSMVDSDGDGVGDGCDTYSFAQPPRTLLQQAVSTSPVPPPGCMTHALADAAWVDSFHLTDKKGAGALSCAIKFYRALLAAPHGPALASIERALAGIGEERVSYVMSRGAGATNPDLSGAISLIHQGASQVLAGDPNGGKPLKDGWKQVLKIVTKDLVTKVVNLLVGKGVIKGDIDTFAPAGATWKGCTINIKFAPNRNLTDCDEVSFIQADLVTDGTDKPIFIGNGEEADRPAKSGWEIDRLDTRKLACYGFNDNGTTAATATNGQSNAGSVACAKMEDSPCVDNAASYCFETCAVCKKGTDKDKVLGCIDWGCTLKGGVVALKKTKTHGGPSKKFKDAVDAWNTAAGANGNKNKGKTPIPALK